MEKMTVVGLEPVMRFTPKVSPGVRPDHKAGILDPPSLRRIKPGEPGIDFGAVKSFLNNHLICHVPSDYAKLSNKICV